MSMRISERGNPRSKSGFCCNLIVSGETTTSRGTAAILLAPLLCSDTVAVAEGVSGELRSWFMSLAEWDEEQTGPGVSSFSASDSRRSWTGLQLGALPVFAARFLMLSSLDCCISSSCASAPADHGGVG